MRTPLRRDRLLAVDLELTCWEDGFHPAGQRCEIIQMGIAEIDTKTLSVSRVGDVICRPVASEISLFCARLTGLTPELVKARGIHFRDACNRIRKIFGTRNKTWLAWGRGDAAIARECALKKADNPMSDGFIDLASFVGLSLAHSQRMRLAQALGIFGLEFEGTPHRAYVDAANTAQLCIKLARRVRAAV